MPEIGGEPFQLISNTKDYILVCFNKTVSQSGLWRAENAVLSTLPNIVINMLLVMAMTHILMLIFKPLHQPRIVAEILAGYFLGPDFRALFWFAARWSPISHTVIVETLGNLALVYHMFLVGLELDFKPIINARKKALSIALSGIAFSLFVGWALARFLLYRDFELQTKGLLTVSGPYFWGIALTTTNFPDLARILVDLKLLYSEVGGLALSSSIISDLCSWVILLIVMASLNKSPFVTIGSTIAFIGFSIYAVRPILSRFINRERAKEESSYNELTCIVMAGAVAFGFMTDLCGSHSMVGPFLLGAIMPRGEFSNMLVERVKNFVPGILMPLFFKVSGGRMNIVDILTVNRDPVEARTGTTLFRLLAVFVTCFFTKTVSTVVAGTINKLPLKDSLALGILMNTKGLLALIILNSGRDIKALSRQSFSILMVVVWAMTFCVGPIIAFVYKSRARPSVEYKQRNVRSVPPNTELRVLACIHNSHNASAIVTLLDASNPSLHSPMHILALHLVELKGHASAMLIVHDACKTSGSNTANDVPGNNDSHSSPSSAFEVYAQQRENVTVRTLTAVSPYTTMHEDICNIAEENRMALVIIPFHKQSTMANGGGMEDSNNSHIETLNIKLIENARCSVGVLVDRGGLGASKFSNCRHHLAVLFIGGVDDREALAYAMRMAEHPNVRLTVIHLVISSGEAADDDEEGGNGDGILEVMANTGRQKKLDELFIDEFKLKAMNESSINFEEMVVGSWEQTLALINDMEGEFDMFIVGRRHGSMSKMTTMLLDSTDDSNINQLGIVGDALVSFSFTATTSILVVQQGGNLE